MSTDSRTVGLNIFEAVNVLRGQLDFGANAVVTSIRIHQRSTLYITKKERAEVNIAM